MLRKNENPNIYDTGGQRVKMIFLQFRSTSNDNYIATSNLCIAPVVHITHLRNRRHGRQTKYNVFADKFFGPCSGTLTITSIVWINYSAKVVTYLLLFYSV